MLDEGANLVSFYVLPDDNSVEDMMEPLTGNISAVLSDGTAAQYLDGWGWIGSLTSFEYFVSLPISLCSSLATTLIVDKGVLNECAAAAA